MQDNIKSPANVNTDVKFKKTHYKEEEKRKYYCSCCGKPYDHLKGNFPISYSPFYAGNNGYVTVCNSCIEKYFPIFTDFFSGNEEKSIERFAQIFDWYYQDLAVAATRKISAGRNRVRGYPSKMGLPQTKDHGTTYLDTIKDRVTDSINSVDDIKNPDIPTKATRKMVLFFGLGFNDDEYVWLQNQYQDWLDHYEHKTKAQEELFKNICLTQLQIQKAIQKGDKVDSLMNAYQNLLGSANIKPTQTNENVLTDQQTFGTLIKKWENEKPISDPSPEWEDVDGIRKYINVWFLGHLCKMMGIKNSYSKEYEDEISQYKVEKPSYIDEDEENTHPELDSVFNDGV